MRDIADLRELSVPDLRTLKSQVGERMHPDIDRVIAEKLKDGTRARRRGVPNITESKYLAGVLQHRPELGHIRYESVKLRLASGAWYTIDFAAENTETHRIELHEVKGFWREAARVRIKVAAERYPMFDFFIARRRPKSEGGGWDIETLRPPEGHRTSPIPDVERMGNPARATR